MITKDYVILAPQGMHARPATTLIKLVKQFKSVVSLRKEEKLVRLNSVLNILSMTAKCGETLTLVIDGEDEAAAAGALEVFFTEQLKDL
ncbi:MAG: HPr family phosphocarrier protein [Puia sp.]|nr:HPr family phosphocarrier protein [Puia sp.]